jgi:hypothetical protein
MAADWIPLQPGDYGTMELLALAGQAQTLLAAVEEATAQTRFQGRYMAADRRLGCGKFVGRPAEVAEPRRALEGEKRAGRGNPATAYHINSDIDCLCRRQSTSREFWARVTLRSR